MDSVFFGKYTLFFKKNKHNMLLSCKEIREKIEKSVLCCIFNGRKIYHTKFNEVKNEYK